MHVYNIKRISIYHMGSTWMSEDKLPSCCSVRVNVCERNAVVMEMMVKKGEFHVVWVLVFKRVGGRILQRRR